MTANPVHQHAAACLVPIAGLAALSFLIQPAPQANAAPCPSSMTFVVGGTGDPASVNAPGVPAGPRTNINYPATLDQYSVAAGERALSGAVTTFRAQCPGSHVTMYGYSQGALVAGNVRDQMPGLGNSNVVLVSDPRAPQGISAMLPSVPFWWTNQGPRPASSIPTANICRANDLVCNIGNPLADPIHAINAAIGFATGAHNYAPHEINPAPGNHTPPSAPGPIPEVVKVPVKVPTPRQMSPVEPFVSGQVQKQWTPPAVARGTAARNVGEVIPPALAGFVPPEIARIVLPH